MQNSLSAATIKPAVGQALKILSKRSRDVVSRRFGLKNGSIETLESIGAGYKITRERVRQIEEVALRDLRKSFDGFGLESQVIAIKDLLKNYGNVLREDTLFRLVNKKEFYNRDNAHLALFMTISSQFKRQPETRDYHALWTVRDPAFFEHAREVAAVVAKHFQKSKAIVHQNSLYELFNTKLVVSVDQTLEPHVLLSYLSISKSLDKNIFDYWGLAQWPEVKPRGIRDKAYLVLKEENEPKHFREIAKLISDISFDNKKVNPNTAHNDLIRDNRFVLVGRGLYALAEWGYIEGTVKDVIIDVLKRSSKPIPKEKIIAKVLESRFVKPNTVLLNLQNSELFRRTKDGYQLAHKA